MGSNVTIMNCPTCHEPVAQSAAFCGNCGQQLVQTPSSAVAHVPPQALPNVETVTSAMQQAYAFAAPEPQRGVGRSTVALILGLLAIVSCFFVRPGISLIIAIVGIIISTLTRHAWQHKLGASALATSVFGLVISVGVIVHLNSVTPQASATAPAGNQHVATASSVTTSCYEVNFPQSLTVTKTDNSCNMTAYDGTTLNTSTDLYKVVSNSVKGLTANAVTDRAPAVLKQDIMSVLPGAKITHLQQITFAGAPAYTVTGETDKATISETAVYYVSGANNFFDIVHISTTGDATITGIEGAWQWQ